MDQWTARELARAERTRFFARVFLGVSLSILLHIVISVLTYKYSELTTAAEKSRPVLVEWLEPSDLKKEDFTKTDGQVVRKSEPPREKLDLNVKAKRVFLSEDKQRVTEEMKARASGMTENRSENLSLSPSRPASRGAAQNEKKPDTHSKVRTEASTSRERLPEIVPNSIFEEGLGDVTADLKKRESPPPGAASASESREIALPSDPRRNRGISTTGEALPQDIQIGDFTALNTDRFIYYTYYARIEEQIRPRWVRFVKAVIFGGGDLTIGKREYVTNLEIVLNREGDFVRAIVHEGSGSRDIDAAPILAFREAHRIPHPPREMVKEDETIRLYYSFRVDQLPPLARSGHRAVAKPGDDSTSD